jgi:hypothetical protein
MRSLPSSVQGCGHIIWSATLDRILQDDSQVVHDLVYGGLKSYFGCEVSDHSIDIG